MRIYEITQKKPTNEGMVGGLANTIAKIAIKNVLGPGVDPAFKGQKVSSGQAQAAGMAQSKALIGPISDNAQKVWIQTLQNMIAKSSPPVTSVQELDSAVIDTELRGLINNLVKSDTRKLATTTDPSGQKQEIAKQLDAASAEVVKQSQMGTTQGLPAAWDKLAEMIVQAQNILAFAQNQHGDSPKLAVLTTGPDGKALFDGHPYNKNDPTHRATVTSLGLNPDTYPAATP